MEREEFVNLEVSYDDIAEYLFESLTELGYVPDGDEVLDLTELFINLILQISEQSNNSIIVVDEEGDVL